MPGTLYLVATPIGNLGDFSPRAVETLQNVDFIAAEDTRVSVKLLNHFDIKKPLVSYHEHNRASAGQAILTRLLGGETCALVTDAGMPAISDPGEDLVRLCAENGVPVLAIPGCCAAVYALAVSGLPTGRFTFEGFLPSGKKERREQLHEDTVRTTLAAAADYYAANEPRGEYVLVIAGREKSAAAALTLEEGVALVLRRREEGMRLKDAVRAVADDTGLSRNALYDAALKNLA